MRWGGFAAGPTPAVRVLFGRSSHSGPLLRGIRNFAKFGSFGSVQIFWLCDIRPTTWWQLLVSTLAIETTLRVAVIGSKMYLHRNSSKLTFI